MTNLITQAYMFFINYPYMKIVKCRYYVTKWKIKLKILHTIIGARIKIIVIKNSVFTFNQSERYIINLMIKFTTLIKFTAFLKSIIA